MQTKTSQLVISRSAPLKQLDLAHIIIHTESVLLTDKVAYSISFHTLYKVCFSSWIQKGV